MKTKEVDILVRNKKGIVIFKIINGKLMIRRLPDMSEYTKSALVSLLNEHKKDFGIDMTEDQLKKFLDFEDENGENEFCS